MKMRNLLKEETDFRSVWKKLSYVEKYLHRINEIKKKISTVNDMENSPWTAEMIDKFVDSCIEHLGEIQYSISELEQNKGK